MRLRVISIPVALFLALFAAACGGKIVDAGKIESDLKGQLEQAGVTVEKIECPEDKDAKKGDSYDCTVTTPEGETKLRGEQIDEDATIKFNDEDLTKLVTEAVDSGGATGEEEAAPEE